jgi:hypothetical protein
MSSDSEADNGLFSVSQDLVPPAVQKSAGVAEVDFDGLLAPPLKLREDLTNGCGGMLWPAGMVLGRYMLRKRDEMKGKSMYVSFFWGCEGERMRKGEGEGRMEKGRW